MREPPVSASTTSKKLTRKVPKSSGASLGLRERNKIDKLHRIKKAARELFLSKGFDDATTRAIASRAGVGIGTVFIYADNKRDLLFLVANDELEATTDKAEVSIRDEASCLQNLLTVFRHHYEFFGRQPKLSRLMLREMTFYDSGRQADRFRATRERLISLVGSIMQRAMDHGMIRLPEDSGFIGWVAFCIYQVELRRWLMTPDLDVETGMAILRRALELLIRGLMPTQGCLVISNSPRPRVRPAMRASTSRRQ
jgi:AcrR family transcriptional regulator